MISQKYYNFGQQWRGEQWRRPDHTKTKQKCQIKNFHKNLKNSEKFRNVRVYEDMSKARLNFLNLMRTDKKFSRHGQEMVTCSTR